MAELTREETIREVAYAFDLASRRETNLERLIFGLGHILFQCPDDCVDMVRAAITNAAHRLAWRSTAARPPDGG